MVFTRVSSGSPPPSARPDTHKGSATVAVDNDSTFLNRRPKFFPFGFVGRLYLAIIPSVWRQAIVHKSRIHLSPYSPTVLFCDGFYREPIRSAKLLVCMMIVFWKIWGKRGGVQVWSLYDLIYGKQKESISSYYYYLVSANGHGNVCALFNVMPCGPDSRAFHLGWWLSSVPKT